jgi:hypothetical protein
VVLFSLREIYLQKRWEVMGGVTAQFSELHGASESYQLPGRDVYRSRAILPQWRHRFILQGFELMHLCEFSQHCEVW